MPETHSEVARRYFAAVQGADRGEMEALLADDFTFTSPWDDHIDRAAYFERCFSHAGEFRFRQPMKMFVEGDEVVVIYETEGKPGGTFHNAECFRIEGGRIRSLDVFFGFIPGAREGTLETEAE
jgi:ketosteroid isomerase-like protein